MVLAGAIALAVQNGLLFVGFLVWLGDSESGFRIGSSSLFLDVPGMALLGVGVLWMAAEAESAGRKPGFAAVCGVLLLVWPAITVLWRWALPAVRGWDYVDVFNAILESDSGMPSSLEDSDLAVRMMLLLWIAASVSLVAAVLLLRFRGATVVGRALLEQRADIRSWEGFAILNALGTVLVAGEFLSVLDGGSAGGLLTAGLVIKVTVVPFNGIYAYALLAYRARTAARASKSRKVRRLSPGNSMAGR